MSLCCKYIKTTYSHTIPYDDFIFYESSTNRTRRCPEEVRNKYLEHYLKGNTEFSILSNVLLPYRNKSKKAYYNRVFHLLRMNQTSYTF